ncbi:metallophosphoesterase [Caldalkalibacillus thermarum TA2.A1]|uniref:DNA repair exonuclease n=1 Tax=Caldalkalibacillus thermarum (strain TA2.A1) TaxID=986075 RepID=F5L6F9_CALTT|nr:DNA repair exonuclease [Caldalkalibacillus thermarum]EGL83069.1 metallophosphoesterase [Caldalkalibacillus thermarum TA2.A1]QZT34906.1 DNA repair exonuclease [Caldalkalibacillus thermarum TA2.A1]
MTLKFIHSADLHLGSPFKGLVHLPEEIYLKIKDSIFLAFESLVHVAIQEDVDFILIAGDIFDSSNPSVQAQLRFKRGLEKLAAEEIRVFIVHGNHDPVHGRYQAFNWPDNVHVFSAEEVQRIPYYKGGQLAAAIYGISYGTARVTDNLARRFGRQAEEPFAIGLLHTNCDGVEEHEPYAPCSKQDLLRAGMDYWALGHVHTRQIIHEDPYIVYPGNLQGRHIREQGERGFYVVEVDEDKRVTLHFCAASAICWEEHELDLSGAGHLEDVEARLAALRERLRNRPGMEMCLCRVNGTGTTPLAEVLSSAAVREELLAEWRQSEPFHERVVWPESFQFRGHPLFDRNEWKRSETIYADLLDIVDQYKGNDLRLEALVEEQLKDLFEHHKAKKYLDPLSREEKQALLSEAEQLIFASGRGGRKE